MPQLHTASFGPQNITGEYAVTQITLATDVSQLAVVLALRGLHAASATRALRVYLDGVPINAVTTSDLPANQPQGEFAETHGAAATRLSVVIPALAAGVGIDVRVHSSNGGDTAVHGTCAIHSLDLFTPAQAAALLQELHLCKAALANRQLQEIATGVVRMFDDDGATLLRTLTPAVDDPDAPTQNILNAS